jgi:hypothetical protein
VDDDDPAASITEHRQTDARPLRTCPSCSARSPAEGTYCPHCGRSFRARRGIRQRWGRRAYVIAAILVVVIGAGAVVLLVRNHDRNARRRHNAAVARLARQEALEEEAKNLKVAERQLAPTIAHDARKLVRGHVLDGPIVGATCTLMGAPTVSDVGSRVVRYNCIAIQRRRAHTIEGARFFATIDSRTGNVTFHGD